MQPRQKKHDRHTLTHTLTAYMKFVFNITGPVSRIMQGVSVDLAVAVTLIECCLKQLNDAINNCDDHWRQTLKDSKDFAALHGVESTFPVTRRRKMKKMPGELASDENVQDPKMCMKISVFRAVVDNVYVQLRERFQTQELTMMQCMRFFTPPCLTSAVTITPEDIKEFCDFYHIDTPVVIRELTEFRVIYKQLQTHVSMDDLTELASCPSHHDANEAQVAVPAADDLTCVNDSEHATVDSDVITSCRQTTVTSWTEYGFIKPLCLLQQLSGFTTLQYVYKILVTLPVTSCTAERAKSRVRIVKNRLRATMLDDWLSSLLCLASEKDILSSLELNDIVNRFADCSDNLRRKLVYA